MRKISKLLWFAAMLGCCLGLPEDASAAAHCFCSLACQDNTNYKSTPLKGWLWDSATLATYTGLDQQGDKNQTDCNTRCTKTCLATWNKGNAGPLACSKGCANGSLVACWSKVGTREWKSAQGVGNLVNTPNQFSTTYKCPPGTRNDNWVDGGPIAAGKKCVFVACDHYPTFPPNTLPAERHANRFLGLHLGPVHRPARQSHRHDRADGVGRLYDPVSWWRFR